jgi:CRP/FNR family cyclic AMP-dependent transcriptional regulator
MAVLLDPVGLFQGTSPEARRTLSERGRLRTFEAGDVLMRQGEESDAMYVILEGRVRVERDTPDHAEPAVLAELGANDVVGEIGVLDGGARTATVTALEQTRTLELHRTLLAVVLIQYPDVAAELLRTLSRRLRSTDEILDTLSRRASDRR